MPEMLCFLSAAELVEGYRCRRCSPVDAVEAHLSRIARKDGELHAFTEVFPEEARAAAVASAQRYAAGNPIGPLDGVPVAVKDLFEIEGKACAAGSATRRGYISWETAPAVTRLRAQGALILGKTQTDELAFSGWGTNADGENPRNPWCSGEPYAAGGSSSGSAVAVAARLATLAIGTDTGGSVRIPAAFNGVVGLKITAGRVDLRGVVPLSPSLDSVGVLARTVRDASLLFESLVDEPTRIADPLTNLDFGVSGMRLAVLGEAQLGKADPEIAAAFESTLRHFESLGARLIEITLPCLLEEFRRNHVNIMMAEAYALYGEIAADSAALMDPAVRHRILSGAISARDYIRARDRARLGTQGVLSAMQGCQALLTPTALTLPIAWSQIDQSTTPSVLTRFVNQIGFCALAVPNGLSRAGLPISLHVVCRPDDEHLALQVARACESGNPMQGVLPAMA